MGDLGFWALAQENPDYLALVTPEGDEVKAGALLGRANQWCTPCGPRGSSRGTWWPRCCPTPPRCSRCTSAALQAGWYLVPINHHLVAPEVAYILEGLGGEGVRRRRALRRRGQPRPRTRWASRPPAGSRWATCRASPPTPRYATPSPTTLPEGRTIGDVMNYTSGTTGNPKGIYRTLLGVTPEQAALGLSGLLFLFGVQPQDDNVHIIGSPLYHTAVLRFGSASMHLGHTIVLMDKWLPEDMLRLIQERRVTTSHMVPTQFHRLLALSEDVRAKYDVSSLRHMIHAAAPCPIDVKHKMIAWWGNAVDEYYAASEGGGTLVTAEEWLQKPGTVGRPWPISEIAVFDDDGNRITEPNVIGTVYMAMQSADFEYHGDKEKTRKNRIGAFFTVGDVGLIDEDGYLFLRDRKIDMIISGGANIYPAEIESVLLSHPKVGDAAVFGIPHEDWGEEVKAVIEPAEGVEADDALAQEILEFCAGRLAKFKTPKTIDFTTEMPRDPNGKLYKRKLRDPYWVGVQRAV